MVTLDENELLPKLDKLLCIEVRELQKYSATPSCSEAKAGMEKEYEQLKKKVRLLTDVKNYIFFSVAFPRF